MCVIDDIFLFYFSLIPHTHITGCTFFIWLLLLFHISVSLFAIIGFSYLLSSSVILIAFAYYLIRCLLHSQSFFILFFFIFFFALCMLCWLCSCLKVCAFVFNRVLHNNFHLRWKNWSIFVIVIKKKMIEWSFIF